MDLQTIDMPRDEARERFVEYQQAVRDRHDDEDAAIMRGYRAMARGSALISLPDAISRGGVDEHGWPRIAVGRANATKVWLSRRDVDGAVVFVTKRWNDGRTANNVIDIRSFGAGTLPEIPNATWEEQRRLGRYYGEELFSVMPNVPPRFRPARGLHLFDVLFEVDEWRLDRPPVTADPALLRHLGGDLYIVCATWDLTDLERHVLAGRAW